MIRPSGPPGQILVALFESQTFGLVLSPLIVAEVERAIRSRKLRPYLPDPSEALLFLGDTVAVADLVPDTGRAAGVCRDPGDDLVLSAAIEGLASVIVTGDHDLPALGEYERIAILSPRRFLDVCG